MNEMKADQSQPAGHSTRLQVLFAFTIFLGSALLFSQQLILGRTILLQFGGVPAVWLTALVVFQVILLISYSAVHLFRNVKVHYIGLALVVFFIACLAQHSFFSEDLGASAEINAWVVALRLLTLSGTSLFVLSLASPLTQKFYSLLPQKDARDPYYLYSASNLGSFAGLLLVPLVLEPVLGMQATESGWLYVFAIFAVLFIMCARFAESAPQAPVVVQDKPAKGAALKWVVLAFLPSALSFGATSTLINDIAALPLLTMVPLALYLLTYVLAFSGRIGSTSNLQTLMAVFSVIYLVSFIGNAHRPSSLVDLLLTLVVFFCAALYCHKQLADTRPATAHLPYYYVMIALGGALGGLVNVFVIPFVLPLSYEFLIFLVLTLALSLKDDLLSIRKASLRGLKIFSAIMCAAVVAMLFSISTLNLPMLPLLLFIALASLLLWPSLLAIFSILIVATTFHFTPKLIDVQRDFFGIKRVAEEFRSKELAYRYLSHGTTLHGMQQIKPQISTEPQTYYAQGSAIADAFKYAHPTNVAAVGMGIGTLACMPTKDTALSFYEIDPGILKLASTYFTYIIDCPPRNVVMGDARFTLNESHEIYDMIVLDAFSSDAIPVHLLTREAFAVYEQHLTRDGLIIIHISNRHLDLRPVLAAIAKEFKWKAGYKKFEPPKDIPGPVESKYVLLTPNETVLDELKAKAEGWVELDVSEPLLWTDDKIDLLPIFKFMREEEE
jgi:hypothetical protein